MPSNRRAAATILYVVVHVYVRTCGRYERTLTCRRIAQLVFRNVRPRTLPDIIASSAVIIASCDPENLGSTERAGDVALSTTRSPA